MKTRKALITEIVKIVISCITIPLYFIKLFCEVAVLPGMDENGEEIISRFNYYFSIYDKIDREGLPFLVWGAIAITIASITLSVLNMIFKEKKALKLASNIVFGVAIALFFVLLFVACSIWYCY